MVLRVLLVLLSCWKLIGPCKNVVGDVRFNGVDHRTNLDESGVIEGRMRVLLPKIIRLVLGQIL